MTKRTYSIEEIKAAFYPNNPEAVIAELTKPKFQPEIVQVYAFGNGYYTSFTKGSASESARPLTLAEHGPDVEALQDAHWRIRNMENTHGALIIKPWEISDEVLRNHEIK